MRIRYTLLTASTLLAILFLITAVPLPSHAAPARPQSRATDGQKEFASFVDGFFAGVKRDWQVPGMAFVAVRDGQVLYQRGYGHMDLESTRPVDPDKTLFRVGSISEAITATALLQLVEKGRLLLDEDVNNNYLRKWKLPQTFENPVTLRHLLTHTGGFDDKALEICAATSADERAFVARLQKKMPARYAPPGRYYSLSTMEYALVGSIIERYSRQSFTSAIKKHVFQPIGMENSFFTLLPEQRGNLAEGHDAEGKPLPYAYRYDMPAVGMSTSASDMGRFMLAQLDEGRLGRNRTLSAMYANSMLRRHFSPHPRIEGTGLGYYERHVRGLRTLQQTGGMQGYSSFLMLVPSEKFGLFFAANSGNLGFQDDLADAVVSRFLATSNDKKTALRAQNALVPADIEGYYRHNRISRHTAEKALHIMGDQLKVVVSGNEIVLSHTRDKTKAPERWAPVDEPSPQDEDGLFCLLDENGNPGNDYMFFQRDDEGRVDAVSIRDVNHTYDKLAKHETYYWQLVLIICFFAASIISALGTLLGLTINKGKLPWEKGLQAATELWTISTFFCLIQFAFVIGMLIAIAYAGHEFAVFVSYQVKALFVIPLVGGLLLAWFWFRLLSNLFNPDHHWAEKLILVSLACVETGYMLFLADWRLLGFMF